MKDSSSKEKLSILEKEFSNLSKFEEKLYEIHIIEFEEKFEKVLKLTQHEFVKEFENRVKLVLEDMYSPLAFKNEKLGVLVKNNTKRIFEEMYKKHYKGVKDNYKPKVKQTGVINFNKHCKRSSNVPLHTCKGKFFPVYDEEKEISYLICLKCEMVYFSSAVLMSCEMCDAEFYTTVSGASVYNDLVPATWEKYHCSALINDQMRCIKCKDVLYLKVKENMLKCQSCKFEAEPKTIVWICMLCKGEFKAEAKAYNKLEYKLIKLAIKEALLNKQHSKPLNLPCCNKKLDDLTFNHKKECIGLLYQSDLIKGRRIVVCEKCKMMNDFDKFIWTCPFCYRRFKQKPKEEDEGSEKLERRLKRSETDKPSSSKGFKSKFSNYRSMDEGSEGNGKNNGYNDNNKSIDNSTSNSNTRDKDDEQSYYKKKLVYNQAMNKSVSSTDTRIDKLSDSKSKKEHLNLNNSIHAIASTSNIKYPYKNDVIEEEANESEELHRKPKNLKNLSYSYNDDESQNKDITTNQPTPQKALGLMKLIERGNNFGRKSPEFEAIRDNRPIRKTIKMEEVPSEIKESMGINKAKGNFEPVKEIIREEIKDNKYLRINKSTKEIISPVFVKTPNDSNKGLLCKNMIEVKEININKNNKAEEDIIKSKQLNESIGNTSIQTNSSKTTTSSSIDEAINFDEKGDFNINDFKLSEQIGEGAWGKIYLAKHKKTQAMYSMKKIIASDEGEIEQIYREYELVNSVKHPGILRIISCNSKMLDETTYALYVLMDLAKCDWDKEIKNRQPFKQYYTEDELLSILKQITSSLSFLQTKNISHRDIKPQNILVFENMIYKISDFGEAKEIIRRKRNQTDTLRGTELFMSPVLFYALQNNMYDIKHNCYKSDVYSLGLSMVYAAALAYNPIYEMRGCNDSKSIAAILNKYFKHRYSGKFTGLLLKLIELNENLRVDFAQLNEYLKVYFNDK